MDLLNDSPFEVAWLPWQFAPGQHRLTLVVKATFKMAPGGTASAAPVQLPPSGDEDYPDVEEPLTSVRYASDLVPFKPRADLLLVGHARAPGGKPAPACQVTAAFGTVRKTLAVIGNRTWTDRLVGSTATDPQPFTALPLRYENSFGGRRFKKNPIGKGIDRAENGERPLPNIEDPRTLIHAPGDKPEPAGFGPLGMLWADRWDKVGTYRGKWFPERWPCFPDDFDWSHFNAAPADQQVEGFLKGDEALCFENLHPKHPQYRTKLPGLLPRCFLNGGAAAGGARPVLKEVPLKADTLWVDMDRELAVVVWRGVAEVPSAAAAEADQLFVAVEPLAGPRKAPLVYATRIREMAAAPAEEPAPPPAEEAEPEEPAVPPVDAEAEMAKAEADARAFIAKSGRNPDEVMAKGKADEERQLREFCERHGIDPGIAAPLTRDDVAGRAGRGESLAGLDLAGLDLSGIVLKNADLKGAQLASANLRGADLSGANLEEADLSAAVLSGANLERAVLKGADLTVAALDSARLGAAVLEGAFCEKATFERADLKAVAAPGADLTGANLAQACLQGGNFAGAILAGAILEGADLRGADLRGAVLERARGAGVKAERADLRGVQAAGCELPGAVFGAIRGADSIWENAVLNGADFTASRMDGADFTAAKLERARLNVANIPGGKFPGANLRQAEMKSTNLFMGSLLQADLTGADLRGSNLYAVEFTDAITDGLQLEFANLKRTRLAG